MSLQYVGIAGAFVLLSAASAMAQSPDWKLVWSDEFEGSKLDHSKWEAEVNALKFPAPFDQPFHLIMNLSVGGGFVGNPDGNTPFPRQLLVDSVRVYPRS